MSVMKLEKKQVRIECSSSLGGGILLYAVLKQLPDGKHYYISTTVYPDRGMWKLVNSDCRFAAISLLQLLNNPELIIRREDSHVFNKSCQRGIQEDSRLTREDYPLTLLEDFNYADELYDRLMKYDEATAGLKAPYGNEE